MSGDWRYNGEQLALRKAEQAAAQVKQLEAERDMFQETLLRAAFKLEEFGNEEAPAVAAHLRAIAASENPESTEEGTQ
jgi:hypothetical protein